MNKLSNISKLIILFAVVIAAGLIIAFADMGGGPPSSTAYLPQNSSSTTSTASSPHAAVPANTATPKLITNHANTSTTLPQSAPITLVAPAANATWTIATQNTIQWSRAPGVTGQIELLNASTGKLVGVILNQVGPLQTSYAWNTRDLLISRTNPLKITVTPGNYIVKILFDGNNLSPVTSKSVTIQQ